MTRYIYRTEGIVHGFYKGVMINIIKTPIGFGIGFTLKNVINKYLDLKFPY